VSLDYAILGFLSEEPASGYDLKNRCFASSIAAYWSADQAQIYRTLDKLEKSALVSETRTRQEKRPDRRVYSITDQGKRSLIGWLTTPEPLPKTRDAFALKLHFSSALKPGQRRALLTSQLEERRAHQNRLLGQRRSLTEDTALSTSTKQARMDALDAIIAQEEGLIASLEEHLSAQTRAQKARAS
jgi:DNA-binding PadR family transcriptional regulator